MYLKLKDANAQIKKEFNFSLKHFFRNFDFFYLDLPGNYFDFFFYLDLIILMFFTLTQFSDQLSSVYGPPEEHDLPLRPWHMSDVWRQDGGVPHMSKGGGKADPSVLVTLKKVDRSAKVIVEKWWKSKFLHTLGGRQNKSWMALFM